MPEFTNRLYSNFNQSGSGNEGSTSFSNPMYSNKSEDTAALVVGGSKSSSMKLNPSNNLLSSKSMRGWKPGASKKQKSSNNLLSSNKKTPIKSSDILKNENFLSNPADVSFYFAMLSAEKNVKSSSTQKTPGAGTSNNSLMGSLANKLRKTKLSSPSYKK